MKSNLDQWNWQVVIAERILQFKSTEDNSINDICYAIKWVTIKWITMSRKGMHFIVSKTGFYVMYKLYGEWPILTSWFLFLKARIYIWMEINSVLGRKQRGPGTPAQQQRYYAVKSLQAASLPGLQVFTRNHSPLTWRLRWSSQLQRKVVMVLGSHHLGREAI